MGMWSYNGVVLPQLPSLEEWDRDAYPYAVISGPYDGSDLECDGTYSVFACSNTPFVYREGTVVTSGAAVQCSQCYCATTEELAEALISKGNAAGFGVWAEPMANSPGWGIRALKCFWTNTDILNEDSSLYLAASNPINLESKLSISIDQMMSYNGTVLPPLPDSDQWDSTERPCALITYDMSDIILWVGASVIYQGGSFGLTNCDRYYVDTSTGQTWRKYWGETKDRIIGSVGNFVIWTNTDLDWLSASEPEACIGATFTCRNLNSMDSVYKIAAWCYPEVTRYLDAPNSYVSAEKFPGKNHIESWSLTGLETGVVYELYACILVNDVATDHNALIRFTLGGVEELDFTGATLEVSWDQVIYNHYNFELTHSGLPYMANGWAAIFDVVGVTDAGDEAAMSGKISSGDGKVNGTFINLEPLTDYTATFEIYYNGKPTGVKCTSTFTTGEKKAAAEHDRNSFLLGFVSGLCGTVATETDAEYNSWTQGYIVGSVLSSSCWLPHVKAPTLAAGNGWWRSTMSRQTITKIRLVDNYTRTGAETASWNADVNAEDDIMCYVIGTELVMSARGNRCIVANEDSTGAFSGFPALKEIEGLSLLNTANVKIFRSMFENDPLLRSVDVSGFITRRATDMSRMFYGDVSLEQLDVSGFETSNVETMDRMFYGNQSLVRLDVSRFQTGAVVSMNRMFYRLENIEALDVSGFRTEQLVDCEWIFADCPKITMLDLRNFDTQAVEKANGMFRYCSSLQKVMVSSGWTISPDTTELFFGCSISSVTYV